VFRVQPEPSSALEAPRLPAPAPPSFRELYDQHFAFTWRSLRYLGVADAQLDDAVQELWIAAHRRLPEFEWRADVKTWLFGIAVNIQRNLYRAERRHAASVPLPSGLSSPVADPMLEREGQEAWLLVRSFMESLDELRRAIFVASLLEGMSPAETAEATGLDVPTIYHRVRSLRQSYRLWAAAQRGEP
jgi:RNA polymerase sigma-70 factor, ECF subfamily